MAQKPSIPKGTRDFLPGQMARRNYIFNTIRSVYQKYGFSSIETPAVEKLTTLTGKYGDEGDQLIFKILNSGAFKKKIDSDAWAKESESKLTPLLSEKALRYDLTVPFARFVVQHQNDLSFPFKRYQIQPVWRADRPQKGRYREFYQCDADVVGSDSLWYEVDFIKIFDDVLSTLQLPGFSIKINNRKILAGIADVIGATEHLNAMTAAIDKLDKIGKEGVEKELIQVGIDHNKVEKLALIFDSKGSNTERLTAMESFVSESEIGKKGIEEISFLLSTIEQISLKSGILVFDPTLARGLDYYTGTIYEVVAHDVDMGSICGGGRYDDLTSIFGQSGLSGVGISFGAERIYDILDQLNLFPASLQDGVDLFFVNFGYSSMQHILKLAQNLRDTGFSVDYYPDSAKMKKQMKHANALKAKFVALLGEDEIKSQSITIKNMESGDQEEISQNNISNYIKENKAY